ncbi:MAG: hypothetical protein ABIF18_03620 [archaeon]
MRGIGDNKKGQQMTLGTIIAIVLGIAVLVFLIFGFASGWNNLWDKVTAYGGGGDNTNTIKQACAIVCSTGDKSGFCNIKRNVKFGEAVNVTEDCDKVDTTTRNSCSASCKILSNSVAPVIQAIGFPSCPSLC